MKTRTELLQDLLGIARTQGRLLSENRLNEIASTMSEREKIVASLRALSSDGAESADEERILGEILELDANMRVSLQCELDETGRELERLQGCNRARRAYAADPAQRAGERYSKDG